MDYATFVSIFPEFADLERYPVSKVDFWIGFATQFVNTQRWKSLAITGIALLTAHELVINSQGGKVKGLITDRSVDGVDYSVDVAAVTIAGDGHFNGSTYGIQYKQLSRMLGAGPITFI